MDSESGFARGFQLQIAGCAGFGSAFSAALLQAALDDALAGGPTAQAMAPWKGAGAREMLTQAVPLRLLGALHDLALSDPHSALGRAYPGPAGGGDPAAAWEAAREVLVRESARFAAFMRHEPQTNEVRRSACLLPGFLTLAAETGLPLRLFEIGASAGLNQSFDRFRYDYGPAGRWGATQAAVCIEAEWRGGSAAILSSGVEVAERAACDRKPVDLEDADARRRLRAYVWADQPDRLARLDAAVALARAAQVRVEAADALDFVRRRAAPTSGAATVVFHSVVWQYLPPSLQADLTAAIAGHGRSAGPGAPFAWLRMEPAPENLAEMTLRLTVWPGGDERALARVHPHGAWIEWLG